MKQINKPVESVVDILDIIKSETSRIDVKKDMESIKGILKEREEVYSSKIVDAALFEIPQNQVISDRVHKNIIISYYKYRLQQKPKGRSYYDKLMLSAPYNICPFCTVRTVSTLDHFLPKSEYPSYSITPINLVPSCRDCNTEKAISYPKNSDDQTFHPYFDKVDDIPWIKAQLNPTEPVSFSFYPSKPESWDEKMFERAKSHFKSYNINHLFSNEANRELRGMQSSLRKLFLVDKKQLKLQLEETYSSCMKGVGVLDWKTIMYKELSTNEWFLDGCSGNNFFY